MCQRGILQARSRTEICVSELRRAEKRDGPSHPEQYRRGNLNRGFWLPAAGFALAARGAAILREAADRPQHFDPAASDPERNLRNFPN